MASFVKKGKTVSAIVPVFNEEKTVGKVVETLLASKLISEVICVDDGSTDKSLEVLKSFGRKIKLINLKRNCGKGFALVCGIKKAKGEVVAFFDSDLLNLSLKHIRTLLDPILKFETCVVLGVPIKTRTEFCRPWWIYLTGERAYYRKMLLPHLGKMAKTRYGVEMFLNSLFSKNETKVVPLVGLITPPKLAKRETICAFKEYLVEAIEIAQEIGRREGLLPEDYQKILNLAEARTLKDLKLKIEKIKNKRVKKFLGKYVLRYMMLVKNKFKDLL